MTKILIVDDDAVMLSLLRTLMELEGNEVVTVSRPEQVVPIAEVETPQLVLMDYHLAGGDAMGPLLILKSREDLKTIPVLITSGMDRARVCLDAGADGFLLKPFRPDELVAKINQMVGEETPAVAQSQFGEAGANRV